MREATVLLADDHAMVAEGISQLLQNRFHLVGIAANGQALIDAAMKLRPDVIVADLEMPLVSGLEAMRHLKLHGVTASFVFLTMHADAELAAQAFREGASGYVLKHSAVEELSIAIEQILDGGTYVTPRLAREILAASAAPATERSEITPRQLEVLRLLADGRRVKQIAATLNLSSRTVETHKYELMHTLGAHSTAELVRYAIRKGLIQT